MRVLGRLLRAFCALAMASGSCCGTAQAAGVAYEARVAVPVEDLRKEPSPAAPMPGHDPLEESQLLYGEPVTVLEESGAWVRVQAVEQPEWTHDGKWEGYPGWLLKSSLAAVGPAWTPDLIVTSKRGTVRGEAREEAPAKLRLSIGSRLKELPSNEKGWRRVRLLDGSDGWILESECPPFPVRSASCALLRRGLVRTARLFLGDPYYWGGRSADGTVSAPPVNGTDCSGLTGLVHLANGIAIPRDAHEQWMTARALNRDQLQPGDLVFLSAPREPRKITHVMLYAGEGRVIEGPGTGETVRETGLEERSKQARAEGRAVYYGTYLP